MIPIRPWQLIMLLLLALGAILPLGGRALDLALNGRTDLEIGSRITPDRPLAPDPPVQISLSGEAPIRVDQFALHPFATFRVEALILSKKKQRWPVADAAAELAPLDLALGWGLMSTPQEIAKLRIWQWGRFLYWRGRDGERFNTGTAIPLAANIHLIPADDTVRSALMRAREGDLIRLEGRLVDAHHPDMGWWRSSRTRADTGDGACEILLVERVVPRAGRTAK